MEGFDFSDEFSPVNNTVAPAREERPIRRVLSESISLSDGGEARPEKTGAAVDDPIGISSGIAGRVLSDGAKKLLASFENQEPAAAAPEGVTPSPSQNGVPAAAAAPVAPAPAPVAAPAAVPDPAATAPETSTVDQVMAQRLLERNRQLLAENEAFRAKPRGEPTAREKALDESERMYHDDSIGALRRFVAVTIGASDPASKEVDDELRGLYHDLTARELQVEPDPAARATREATRTRRMLERDRRERAAATTQATEASPDRTAEAVATVKAHLSAVEAASPLVTKLAQKLDGVAPEALIWREIKHGIETGELDGKLSNINLITAASKRIEARYQALRDEIVAATSTATPAQATPSTTDSKTDPAPGVRAITNASASVAPATPPATQPAKTEEPKKYRSEKDRRLAIARKIFDA